MSLPLATDLRYFFLFPEDALQEGDQVARVRTLPQQMIWTPVRQEDIGALVADLNRSGEWIFRRPIGQVEGVRLV